MSSVSKLLHPALETSPAGVPLAQAHLRDQQRMAVLFQGAALVAHLEHAGFCLLSDWDEATVDDDALLRLGPARRAKSVRLPQVLLLDLLDRLFPARGDEGRIAGKGASRNVARSLRERWRQFLTPLSPDQAVAEILERTPFLWESGFASARLALAAELVVDGRTMLWIAGPGANRVRILARAGDRRKVEALLRSAEAHDLWDGFEPGDDPVELAGRGETDRAIAAWRRSPPRRLDDALLFARCLVERGLVAQANDVVRKRTEDKACLLRLQCLGELGEREAAQQLIARLAKKDLPASQLVSLAEVAVRLLSHQGHRDQSRDWVSRAFQAAGSQAALRLRAKLLAAEAAWDLEDLDAMTHHLDEARGAIDHPELDRRWHEVRSLLALAKRDGAAAVRHSAIVLRRYRRRMTVIEAGRRWSDLSYGRVLLDDLAGAERAIRKANLLLGRSESHTRNTLAVSNLAEIRIRQGDVQGVHESLQLSTAENRKARNFRGLVGDLEIQVRLDLIQGRPEVALRRSQEALELIREHDVGNREMFDLFSARAYGWLGKTANAEDCLERVEPKMLLELDTEERPAILALAGRLEPAAREAAGTAWAELWSSLAAGIHPRPSAWEELERLTRFRAARLVYDYLIVAPEAVPPVWIRRAIATYRSMGALSIAQRLESRFHSAPWRALSRYLSSGNGHEDAVPDLFNGAGYLEAQLVLEGERGETLLKSGPGGERILQASHGDGRLLLRAPVIDATLETLFRVVCRDLKSRSPRRGGGGGKVRRRGIIGESPAFCQALERLEQLAKGELAILILGETGVGKELAARRVHDLSSRSDQPFEAVNCAALPEENMVQSELFGHRQGSFTGADRDREGIFERARRGTVFLDEIGDLPLGVQGQLLRVLQEGEVRRLGDDYVRKVDVRVVAATHRDLRRMVEEGSFREDLYFRLKGAEVALPALRERGHDVLLLARHLLLESWENLGWRHESPPRFSASARALLLRHAWPGNVRELRQAMASAATLARGREIEVEDLGLGEETPGAGVGFHQQVDELSRQLIHQAMLRSGGNRTEAARDLALTRQTLAYQIRRLGIDTSVYRRE